jgi:hypothetical protein
MSVLTVREVARRLQVCRPTARQLPLPWFNVRGRIRLLERDLDTYLQTLASERANDLSTSQPAPTCQPAATQTQATA